MSELDRRDALRCSSRREIASRLSEDNQCRPRELQRTAYRVIDEFWDRTISDEMSDPALV